MNEIRVICSDARGFRIVGEQRRIARFAEVSLVGNKKDDKKNQSPFSTHIPIRMPFYQF